MSSTDNTSHALPIQPGQNQLRNTVTQYPPPPDTMISRGKENTACERRGADAERERETVHRKPDVLEKISEWRGGWGVGGQ